MLPCKLWSVNGMNNVTICCIILHNMIIKDEWDPDNNNAYLFEDKLQVDDMNHKDVMPLLDLQKIHGQYMDI